jgi:ethanolamine-phosphate cytidylyltransferase
MGIYQEIGEHNFSAVNAGEIVERILKSRAMYEERQRVKGVKGIGEEATRRREQLEEEQRQKEKENGVL